MLAEVFLKRGSLAQKVLPAVLSPEGSEEGEPCLAVL